MGIARTTDFSAPLPALRWRRPGLLAALLIAAAAAQYLALHALLPAAVVLPAMALISLFCALAASGFAWLQDSAPGRIGPRDIAAVFAAIGAVAGMLSDPEQAMQLLSV